ncbi:TAF domain containing protein [Trichuris trichiura]|uniref:TAF domain containing protein n=1 Tax=Trichuris trichiura TaxID=36087 RepID=A0A077ZIP9_TRITR|nr:TAF domain containing protein [Trichuris trichiura]
MKLALSKEFFKPVVDAFSGSGTVINEDVLETVRNAVAEKICVVVLASVEFMKHVGRKKLFVADCIAALKKLKEEPIFGHQFEEGHGFHFVDESNCFVANDTSIVDLKSLISPE